MTTPANHREELLRAFHIGPADIDANRAGRLSDIQAGLLRRSGIMNMLAVGVVGVALALILAFVANKPLKPAQYITALVLFGITLAVGVVHLRKTFAAAADGRVEGLSGEAQVQMRGKAGFYLSIAGKSFKLPVRPWHVGSGVHYRAYVAPKANQLMALEPEGS